MVATQALTTIQPGGAVAAPNIAGFERALVMGDLTDLTEKERIGLYRATCESLGLNPLTRPFDYVAFPKGGLRLYPNKSAAEQLRTRRGISIEVLRRETANNMHFVTVRATDRTGRSDEATGIMPVGGLAGEALANAMMKAETKAKRRVTLSICGLILFEEPDQAGDRDLPPGAAVVSVDLETGEVREEPPHPEAVAVYHLDGSRTRWEDDALLWKVGEVEGVTVEVPNRGTWLKATQTCPDHPGACYMLSPDDAPDAWRHGIKGTKESCYWVNVQEKYRAIAEAQAADAALGNEAQEIYDGLIAEEAPAVAEQAPFAMSSAPA